MLCVRPATSADVSTLLRLIRGLAAYERAPEQVVATEEDLLRDGFGQAPRFHSLLAEHEGTAVGFALYSFLWSTWQGRAALHLEDLFVEPQARGLGLGLSLLRRLARIALDEGCTRFQWNVLDWNTPAIGFYEGLGAHRLSEWALMRIEGEQALRTLADSK